MATRNHQALGASAAGEAADQELVNLLKNTVQAKVLATLEAALPGAVNEAVQSAIVEASRVPGEAPAPQAPAPMKLSGRTAVATRPKEGGVCAAVWEALDKVRADSGNVPTLDQVRKLAKRRKWNANNARIEYYRWRAHNGIQREAKKQAPEARA
jgi:hypothetical protein